MKKPSLTTQPDSFVSDFDEFAEEIAPVRQELTWAERLLAPLAAEQERLLMRLHLTKMEQRAAELLASIRSRMR